MRRSLAAPRRRCKDKRVVRDRPGLAGQRSMAPVDRIVAGSD
jgi:hypothetical protein